MCVCVGACNMYVEREGQGFRLENGGNLKALIPHLYAIGDEVLFEWPLRVSNGSVACGERTHDGEWSGPFFLG